MRSGYGDDETNDDEKKPCRVISLVRFTRVG